MQSEIIPTENNNIFHAHLGERHPKLILSRKWHHRASLLGDSNYANLYIILTLLLRLDLGRFESNS